MAKADYRLCDYCEGKAFYDSYLNYEYPGSDYMPDGDPYRKAGKFQNGSQENDRKWAARLDYLGDWAVLCVECAKTHKTVVVPI